MTDSAVRSAPAVGYHTEPILAPRARLYSIDLLRGVVIVLMALDHVKGHLVNVPFDLVDLSKTTPAYFLTRFASHFCAPVFVFLAGTGAFLYGARGRRKGELAWFLLSRGIWLIILELTVIRFSWFLDLTYAVSVGQVIWVIGVSMMVLAGFVYLPVSATTVFGVALIAFHNLADGVKAEAYGSWDWVWCILHTGETVQVLGKYDFLVMYPLIPWVGVLAAGYGFGALMLLDHKTRRREVFGLGLALTILFVVLRFTNAYGDKLSDRPGLPGGPWSLQKDWLFTFFSFINCQKYPPSLDFLLMTLGPALMFLAWCEREAGRFGRFFIIFGRVPLFFYILHWYVIKAVMIGLGYWRHGDEFFRAFSEGHPPENYGYDLWVVYVVWAGVVLALFPLCYWFAGVKARSRAAWLSYL
jgi:uncharacterized membrane protein